MTQWHDPNLTPPPAAQKGDYVLATKFNDGDPGAHWGVGYYDREENGRHYIVDGDGKQLRANGFRRVGHITPEYGRWLLSAAQTLEASPPGAVDLWGMMGIRAKPDSTND